MKNRKLMRFPRGNAEETCQSNFRRVAGCSSSVKCECGAEILLLPDVRAMSHAIEVHVAEHRQKSKTPAGAAAEAERVRDALIAQVLSKASKSENDGTHDYVNSAKSGKNSEC